MTDIFVFGSNLAGKHGKGAALFALNNYGAVSGIGEGLQGQSYGIPTKDGRPGGPPLHRPGATLPLDLIKYYVDRFKAFAAAQPELTFKVTPIGCGLAGYVPEQIAPMFRGCSDNIELPPEFLEVLNRS